MPDFEEDDDDENHENDEDFFNYEPEPDLLPPAFVPVPVIPPLRRSEDWVPGVTGVPDEEISRNRDSLENLFDDSNPVSPSRPVPVSVAPPVITTTTTNARKSPRVPPLRCSPRPAAPPTRKLSARRARPESTEERILREAAAARAALHERILHSARMAAKFRAQNERRAINRN